jgi:hypothetical protein
VPAPRSRSGRVPGSPGELASPAAEPGTRAAVPHHHMRVLILIALAAAAAPLRAEAPASVQRAKACDAATAGRNLSDAQYRSYMQACLASTRPPAELFESMRTIERRCNTIANARQLTAQDRLAFMESCRRKGG